MSHDPDSLDRQLLDRIQVRVPLVREPFAVLADEVGVSERVVLDRLRDLHAGGGVIREIAAIFDVVRLGFCQSLVALAVPEDEVDRAGSHIAGHPGVSHCYGREGRYNLWFTLAVSPRSTLGLDPTVAILAEECHAAGHMILPTLTRYKLDVRLVNGRVGGAAPDATLPADTPSASPSPPAAPEPGSDAPRNAASPGARTSGPVPTDAQIRAIRALQVDLPLEPDPFAQPAADEGLSADDLLAGAADFLAAGWMRRYAAVLYHRRVGARENVMVVWRVGQGQADLAGRRCAAVPAVSHCYLRPTYPDWPYGLYTMIHGRSRADCEQTVRAIQLATGLTDCRLHWTTREYKKRRVRLFDGQEQAWERQRR